jgi:hypothetical protein
MFYVAWLKISNVNCWLQSIWHKVLRVSLLYYLNTHEYYSKFSDESLIPTCYW